MNDWCDFLAPCRHASAIELCGSLQLSLLTAHVLGVPLHHIRSLPRRMSRRRWPWL